MRQETKEVSREAGREMDAEVAERVFGLEVIRDWPCGYQPDGCELETVRPLLDAAYLAIEPLKPNLEWLDSHPERHPVTPWDRIHDGRTAGVDALPFYSTDIKAAFQVVEKMYGQGGLLGLVEIPSATVAPSKHWSCSFRPDAGDMNYALTAPLAICLAALAAVARETALKTPEVTS